VSGAGKFVPPDSLAGKLRTAAERHRLFVIGGGLNAGSVAAFGVVTFVHPLLGVALADLAITSGSIGAVSPWIPPCQALAWAYASSVCGLSSLGKHPALRSGRFISQ